MTFHKNDDNSAAHGYLMLPFHSAAGATQDLFDKLPSLRYAGNVNLVFNKTAFKHGITAKDIDCAMTVPLTDIILEKHVNKYLIIGFDTKGNLLEIMYNMVDEKTANVFHAMKCRKELYKYLPGRM